MTKKVMWNAALVFLVFQLSFMAAGYYKSATWLAFGFQSACLIFMREDVK